MKGIGCICITNKIDNLTLDTVESLRALNDKISITICYYISCASNLPKHFVFKKVNSTNPLIEQIKVIISEIECKKIILTTTQVKFSKIINWWKDSNYENKVQFLTKKRFMDKINSNVNDIVECPKYIKYLDIEGMFKNVNSFMKLSQKLISSSKCVSLNYNQQSIIQKRIYCRGVTMVLLIQNRFDKETFSKKMKIYSQRWTGKILVLFSASFADQYFSFLNVIDACDDKISVCVLETNELTEENAYIQKNLFAVSKYVTTTYFVPIVFGKFQISKKFENLAMYTKKKPCMLTYISKEHKQTMSCLMRDIPYTINLSPSNIFQIYITRICDEINIQSKSLEKIYENLDVSLPQKYFYYLQGTGRSNFYSLRMKELLIYKHLKDDKM